MSQPPDLSAGNLAYAEAQYERYLADPGSVDEHWQALFATWGAELNGSAGRIGPSFSARSIYDPAGANSNGTPSSNGHAIHAVG
ncbi:MAG: hypothetical protein AAF711_19025, partial [Planctomycetota bacterium]